MQVLELVAGELQDIEQGEYNGKPTFDAIFTKRMTDDYGSVETRMFRVRLEPEAVLDLKKKIGDFVYIRCSFAVSKSGNIFRRNGALFEAATA